MNKLIDRLKRYRARDFVYFLTPPIFYKFFSMIGSSNNNRPKFVDESNFSHELSMLEEKGMDYFINEDVIKISKKTDGQADSALKLIEKVQLIVIYQNIQIFFELSSNQVPDYHLNLI